MKCLLQLHNFTLKYLEWQTFNEQMMNMWNKSPHEHC